MELTVEGKDLTEQQARRLVQKVNRSADQLGWALSVLFTRRGWLALGYRSWAEFAQAEFAPARESLSRSARRLTITTAAEAGMSGNAIATALGISAMTVSRELAAAEVDRTVVIDEHGTRQYVRGRGHGPKRLPSTDRTPPPPFPVAALRTRLRAVELGLATADEGTMREVLRDLLVLIRQWEAAVGLEELQRSLPPED